jgi:non-ribosomal peptide synthase protein (TIGR01720 family)
MLLQVPAGVSEEVLTEALQALLDHHDALRMRLLPEGDLEVLPIGAVRAADCLRRIAIDGLDEADLRARMRERADAAAGELLPSAGALVRAVWFDAGTSAAGRLLLVIHHLAVDGVSWRILQPDFTAAMAALTNGRAPQLAERSSSLRRWAQRLAAEATDAKRVSELPFWRGMLEKPSLSLFEGTLDLARDTVGSAGQLTLSLPATMTGALLTRVPAAFHAGINEVLLTALALAVADWCRKRRRPSGTAAAGSHAVLIELEGHGREEVFPDIDLSRTVGWFTSLFPLRLDPGAIDLDEALAGGPALGDGLKRIKEQLRGLRDHGLGYGLLRHLNPETAKELAGFTRPQLGFNYLGRFAAPSGSDLGSGLAAAPEGGELGGGGHGNMPVAHALEVNALTLDGAEGSRLSATWSWAPALVSEAEVRDLAQRWFAALEALVRHVDAPDAGGRSPSDLPLVGLSQREIERLERKYAR